MIKYRQVSYTNKMDKHKKFAKTAAFTIVELLIVIVIIGILAAIAIVAYNGVQQRARTTAAKGDINSLGKSVELFKANSGEYPKNPPDINQALADYNLTQLGHMTGAKDFVYCASNDSFAIIAWTPISAVAGDTVYFYKTGSGISSFTFDPNAAGNGISPKLCNQAIGTHTYNGWSYNL